MNVELSRFYHSRERRTFATLDFTYHPRCVRKNESSTRLICPDQPLTCLEL